MSNSFNNKCLINKVRDLREKINDLYENKNNILYKANKISKSAGNLFNNDECMLNCSEVNDETSIYNLILFIN